MRSHECSRQAFAPARSGMRGLLTFILATLTTPGFAANASFFQLCRVYHGDSEMETCDVVAAASFRELQDRADVIASTEPFSDAVDERCPRFTSHTPAHAPAAAAVGATLVAGFGTMLRCCSAATATLRQSNSSSASSISGFRFSALRFAPKFVLLKFPPRRKEVFFASSSPTRGSLNARGWGTAHETKPGLSVYSHEITNGRLVNSKKSR